MSYSITSHFRGYLGPPLPTLISDVINGRSPIRDKQTRLVNRVLLKSQQFGFVVSKLVVESSETLEIEKYNLQKELGLIVPKESTYNFVSRKCKKHGESEIVLVIESRFLLN